jgi:hypothetical protein
LQRLLRMGVSMDGRGGIGVALVLAWAALLGAGNAHAQAADDGVAAQQALRDRWRLRVELGMQLTASVNVGMSEGIVATNNPQARLAAGVSLWRAVHPALDVGASLGVMGPHSAYAMRSPIRCGAGEEQVETPQNAPPLSPRAYAEVRGATPYAVAGMRWRPWGARLPLHVVAQGGVSVRLLSGQVDDTLYCGTRDPVTGTATNHRAVPLAADGARVPAFVWNVGVQSHFGAREQWSFGTAVWVHHDGPVYPEGDGSARQGPNVSAVFSLGFSPDFGPALPEAALARGRRVRNITLATVGAVVGGVALITVVGLVLNPP